MMTYREVGAVLLLALQLVGCKRAGEVLNIDTILADCSKFDGRIVTITGCYQTSVESAILISCEPNRRWQPIRVDDARLLADADLSADRHAGSRPITASQMELYKSLIRGEWPNPVRVAIEGRVDCDPRRIGAYSAALSAWRVLRIEPAE